MGKMIFAVFVRTVFDSMGAKVRLSEQKTKFYLSFLEREYLRAKLKGSAAYLRPKAKDTIK